MIGAASREDIEEAMRRFDKELAHTPEWSSWQDHGNHKYAIVHQGKRFPIKQIVSMASGTPVSGFVSNEARSFLATRGFEVVQFREDPPNQAPARRYWVEKTIVAGRPDRQEGPYSLGRALWSPQTSTGGAKIYKTMLEVRDGDVVFHLIDNKAISGVSIAAGVADETFVGVPNTEWENRPGYLVPLQDYVELEPQLERSRFLKGSPFEDELKAIVEHNRGLFYTRGLELNQGAYLTEAPPELVSILDRAYRDMSRNPLPHVEDLLEPIPLEVEAAGQEPFTVDDAADGLFMPRAQLERILGLMRTRQNVILQGPPGVGKSFVAKRLAYALIGSKDPSRVEMVQFHQSYAYEDFIQGYRPTVDGGFELRDGLFYSFCQQALMSPDIPHVFIIDEINRGNLSKVFGELMLLIEADKRGPEWAVKLAYHGDGDPRFFVPENIYILGMMNTADRSLAVVDYALRRRFAFIDLEPAFGSEAFLSALHEAGVPGDLATRLTQRIGALNQEILEDSANLGPGFRIGHSFFCGYERNSDPEAWYRDVIETEIEPLLREYYFDMPERAREKALALLA